MINYLVAEIADLFNTLVFILVICALAILILIAALYIGFLFIEIVTKPEEYNIDRIISIIYSHGYYFIVFIVSVLCLVVSMLLVGMFAQIVLIQEHLAAIRFRFELKDELEERAKNREQSR